MFLRRHPGFKLIARKLTKTENRYIIRRSTHPTATGGSPIVTWLPNQLQAVMKLMTSTWEGISVEQRAGVSKDVVEMMENVVDQRDKLQKEVDRWCQERGQ